MQCSVLQKEETKKDASNPVLLAGRRLRCLRIRLSLLAHPLGSTMKTFADFAWWLVAVYLHRKGF
jgi:hypothetical protein